MTGIIGAGFGLYGYLPAVMQTEGKAALLEEAKEIFLTRPELQIYKDNIEWIDDIDKLISVVNKLIICVPPKIQEGYFDKVTSSDNISHVIFEKPIASTPEYSDKIISRLKDCGKIFRIGYTFLYTDWFRNITSESIQNTNIKISWEFKAYHYKHDAINWKRYNDEGGGVIRFFGIHLFPILIKFGFTKVISSETFGKDNNDLESWKAIFESNSKFQCSVYVNSDSAKEIFSIEGYDDNNSIKLIDFVSPFEKANDSIDKEDNRVGILKKLLSSLNNEKENAEMYSLYEQSNSLWMQTENINKFCPK